MFFKKVLLFFTLTICGFSSSVFSQTNYSNIKVDQMTDNQIRQLIQSGTAAGYDDWQLIQMTSAQGMPGGEVEKLRARISNIRRQEQLNRTSGRIFLDSTDNVAIRKAPDASVTTNGEPRLFGEDLFKNGSISFEPNMRMATPKGYVIGPDDELLIDMSGNNEANYNLKVSPEGVIRLQYIGNIAVAGLTIEQATAKLKGAMAKTYPDISTGQTTVALTLGNIRSIRITILGEASRPGSYTLSSLSTVFNALYASGGPNKNGSFRNVQVIRNNKVISTTDVYTFLLKGMQPNLRLQDQDVINIPVYKTKVELSGEVKRPAIYEVLPGETLQNVIDFAGGFTSQSYRASIKVFKNTSRERRISDVTEAEFGNYKPSNGDKYIVETILSRFENRIEIDGAVFRPGKFELEKGLTVKGLINKADGLKEDAFLNNAYIYRVNADNTLTIVPFSVDRILKGTEADIPLQREDKVTISSIFDLRDEYQVQVQGEVRNPGMVKYAESLNLETVIQMAGGFREGATPNRVEISRRVKNSDALSTQSTTAQIFTVNVNPDFTLTGDPFILKPFDIVTVRSSEAYEVQKQVTIIGEVLYPGRYTIQRKDEKISDIIKRAGGLTGLAFPEGASLRRPGTTAETQNNVNAAGKGASVLAKADDDNERLKSLQRIQMQQADRIDTARLRQDPAVRGSDLVGIDLKKIIASPASRYDLILNDGDVIKVPQQLQTIRVSGEVLKPTNIVYESGKGVLSYINESGSFTYNAKKKAVYVQYANGSIKSASGFLFFRTYPRVKPGAEIFVPKKQPREPLGTQAFIAISSTIVSLAVVVVALFRK